MTTYYKPVSVDEELPEKNGVYTFLPNDTARQPHTFRFTKEHDRHIGIFYSHWLKPVEGVLLSGNDLQMFKDAISYFQSCNLESSDIGQGLLRLQEILTSGSDK